MKLSSLRKSLFSKAVGFSSALATSLYLATSALAQTSTGTTGTTTTTKGGTTSSLPEAGTTELTYLLFIGGIVLFVIGTIKVVQSFRE
ncbi:hypothetical protein A3A54_01825 [Candidatus Curtissbacteria bacterium RIFCSPLOWO2_01_FULL_39_62]|uniref:Gram-positive cocci surface proteins LPxTG domain-containing protein n=2 Tax=Candidatus Curtissiibacteriota TaxID=1752717 RepID=A0A1F5GA99_9BACT|nr:MAG: hypothetical protein A2775_01910 [Candidatus Curtissbacteria bacterium RIFCSPHIGHO2_01_FULL_39_57]OGD88755.1 MAG: hypothetical protein A3D04_04325 [Candidatus Curtissbacteria bacterium RIFCSPHIGHO2_02_FULL_40_16b]OGD89895.1 MAG: hypothetical protein A3E11_01465 [Candidatus Curtissbacteria bacterium RIFCSPHIGHO2_12_FULL_38_37]OGD99193.1 MAG: hypothetical protein A3J17_01025 [Candidatus Curtissbacteria bacterium RIFCSPLOWO2_02_FULL_40_11]OGE01568.1 MAG: hypothetical protein A3A54_01825 [C